MIRERDSRAVVMPRRHRVRRAATWAGVAACVLIVAAWVVNFWWGFGYVHWSRGRSWNAGVECGVLIVATGSVNNPFKNDLPGWYALPYDVGYFWLPRHFRNRYSTAVWIPLWLPFTLLGATTAWLWWRDRRWVRSGHCPCGYDLAGLALGAACPECGRKAVV